MSPAPGPSKRVEWRIYGVIVDGAIVCTLASDERVDSADIAAVMGIEARDVTVRRLAKVTVELRTQGVL